MKTPSLYLLSAITATTLLGCGAFSKKENEKVGASQAVISLAGTWKTVCGKRGWFESFVSEQGVKEFNVLSEYKQETTLFSDESCTVPDLTVREEGSYAELGASPSTADARDINYTITAASLTPRSDASAATLNKVSYCSISNWQKDVTVDVIGRDCLGASHAKGEVVFDIYKLENDAKQLTVGKTSLFLDKSDAASRPASLDATRPFMRQ